MTSRIAFQRTFNPTSLSDPFAGGQVTFTFTATPLTGNGQVITLSSFRDKDVEEGIILWPIVEVSRTYSNVVGGAGVGFYLDAGGIYITSSPGLIFNTPVSSFSITFSYTRYFGYANISTLDANVIVSVPDAYPYVTRSSNSLTIVRQPYPPNVVATGSGVTSPVTHGAPQTFTITGKDVYALLVTHGGNTFTYSATNANTLSITDNMNGTYTARYTPNIAGTTTLSLSLYGMDIPGFPKNITVV